MTSSRSYRDLIVWKKSINLVTRIYNCTSSFPREEKFGITSQMRRAGTSIPANIAEGQARHGKKEFLQFLSIAQGSLAELETFLIISKNLDFLTEASLKELLTDCEEIAKLLYSLKRSLNS
ncbi:MAG: four helix bundle protein [Deltaproteobacteria bacterium]|nr:four helix bundle protein [Deltaproteobacteria bacterium]MBW2165757.1 four helix bundle protein [Deltaproteobacteria bacterium]MBW2591298.1 four helix bundle protein [Deltaproteobacteria bacterium]MBW2664535.1 four helix bundle protein [Deltaproteobacteria bacterium]